MTAATPTAVALPSATTTAVPLPAARAAAISWNFGDLFDALDLALAPRTALIHGDLIRTWGEFGARSNRLARALLERGLRPGDKVAFFLRNSPAYLELFAACVKARLVHVNVNYRYVEAELDHVLRSCDARAVVFDTEFVPQIEALRGGLPHDTVFAVVGGEDDSASPAAHDTRAWSFERLCTEGDPGPLQIARSGDDLYFQCTGGTTGMPKAVMWRQHDRISLFGMARGDNARDHAESVATRSNHPVVVPACPLMHSTGLTTALLTLCAGGAVVTLTDHRFDPTELLTTIDRRNVTSVAIVGDAFGRPILDALQRDSASFSLQSVTSISSAGVMWSAECKQELLRYFTQATLRDSLGSSEGSGLAAMETRPGAAAETGAFALGEGVKVFTDDLREVEPGSGELGRIAKSGFIPLGYYRDETKTAETFPTIDGVRYAVPGDWCRVEADGTIRLIGRGSTCINTGGEKVFPEEVETALCRLHGVVDALVIGVPDDRWGEVVVAVVQRESAADVGAEYLRSQLRQHLASYKVPKLLYFIEAVPRAASGKADYAGARRYVERHGLDHT